MRGRHVSKFDTLLLKSEQKAPNLHALDYDVGMSDNSALLFLMSLQVCANLSFRRQLSSIVLLNRLGEAREGFLKACAHQSSRHQRPTLENLCRLHVSVCFF